MALYMYTIFNAPLDYPDHFVMRRFIIAPGSVTPDRIACLYGSLEEAREDIPSICTRFERHPTDTLSTVETWI